MYIYIDLEICRLACSPDIRINKPSLRLPRFETNEQVWQIRAILTECDRR
jgi:hypothetical protein